MRKVPIEDVSHFWVFLGVSRANFLKKILVFTQISCTSLILFLALFQLLYFTFKIFVNNLILLIVSYFSAYAFYSCLKRSSAFLRFDSFSCRNWQKAVSLFCKSLSFCLRSSSPDLNSVSWLRELISTFETLLFWTQIAHESRTFCVVFIVIW